MWLSRIIGHRGSASLAPENTLSSLRKAQEAGVGWVEIDVVLLGDGHLVIHHDQSLRRCTNGRGRLLGCSLEDIRKLDAGSWFSPAYANERIPTLVEALTEIQSLGLGLNLEIKMHRHSVKALVSPLLGLLRQYWKGSDYLVLSSFSHAVLKQCHERAPEYRIGHLFETLPRRWLSRVRAVNAVTVHTSHKRLRESQVRAVKTAGYEIYCYTVNDRRQAEKLWLWGVDGIFTDMPQAFPEYL